MTTTELESLVATPVNADLGPGPRAGVRDEASLTRAMSALKLDGIAALHGLVLLWHDHHETAHELVQDLPNADASYVHAILHRREPDYANSQYWFHRVGRHTAYGELGPRVAKMLEERGEAGLQRELAPAGKWDALAMVNACAAAVGRGDAREALLKEVQRIEFLVLASYLASAGPR